MMKDNTLSRRRFLKTSAQITTAAAFSLGGALPVFSLPARDTSAPAASKGLKITPGRKALVFIMLDGGNDSFNMLVPLSSPHYEAYQNTRGSLALKKERLLPLKNFTDSRGRRFGIHPAMPEIQKIFNKGKLAFMANIAPLVTPVKKNDFYAPGTALPLGLLSHADQFNHWQTSRPVSRTRKGWFGLMADAIQPGLPLHRIPMNISLAGNNILQNGSLSSSYAITDQGSVGLVVNEEKTPLNTALESSFEDLLTMPYINDPFKQTYLEQTRKAQARHRVFGQALSRIHPPGIFSDSPLSRQLSRVAACIKAADKLGTGQQTFFLRYTGWDHHDELLENHARMLGILSRALGEFQKALEQMGVAENVITFTGSDFGRTLTSNGNGTDHGWGGNTIVMGNPTNGRKIFGSYPDLTTDSTNPLDAGDGVIIPTMATDQLYSELAAWFGVSITGLAKLFPNLIGFDPADAPGDLVKKG